MLKHYTLEVNFDNSFNTFQKGAQTLERLTQLGTYMNTLTHSGIKCCYTKRSVNGARYHRGHANSRNYCEYDDKCKRRCYSEYNSSLVIKSMCRVTI